MGLLGRLDIVDKLMVENGNRGEGKIYSPEQTTFTNQDIYGLSNELTAIDNSTIDFDKINPIISKEAVVLITNIKGEIIYLNDKCSETLGYEPKELIGKHTRIFKTGIHTREFYRNLWNTLLSGQVWKGEITAKKKDGSFCWYFMLISPIFNDQDQIHQFLTLRFDLSEQKKMQREATFQEIKYNSAIGVLENTVVGAIDQEGKILYISPAVEDILGHEVSKITGLSIFDHIDSDSLPGLKSSLEELKGLSGSSKSIEIILRSNKGELLPVAFTAKNYLDDPMLRAIVFSYRDITEQKWFLRELKNVSYYDLLTELPNYRCFEADIDNVIEQSKENATNIAVIQLALDNFKYVNSSLGHPAGDQLLKDFSNKMVTSLPKNIKMYRENGDVFILIMKGIQDVEALPETLEWLTLLSSENPYMIDGNEIYITVSMGVSVFPYSGINKEELIKNSEVAMFQAKEYGKNQFQIFSPTMNLQTYKQFTLRNDCKHALLRDEFSVYFQPRISSLTNQMVSAEALIRWNHPKWGQVLPDEFISMVEDSGLIVPIGEWVIKKVCLELKKWESESLPVKKVSINLSALQLIQPTFVETVSTILKEMGIESKWIEFEITETVLIEKEEVLQTLLELKNLGFTLALDDFGTGYSSLNYLKKYPCDVIKLDKCLIQDIDKDRDNHEIIASIISLCHKLKKTVVAEGVETQEQLMMLKSLRCNQIQGYLFSKPVDGQKFMDILKEGINVTGNNTVFDPNKNKRTYFRVPLQIPLVADMTINEIAGKKVNIGSTEVIVKNIGPGGLCFYSPLKLPVSKEITLQFTTEILSEQFTLKGNIVWYKETDNYNQYGVEFMIHATAQEKVIKILNSFQVMLRKKSVLPGCRFFTE